jgi:primosomal protein N' (replication factor Y)
MLQAGRQVLVLVPEIALTPQTLARFEARFGRADVIHSNMTDRARLTTWLKAKRGELSILIGTRSAILTPFFDLGLIVVDEEHDVSFKQQDGLRYSARDVAVKRAQQLGIPLVLGSATPSFESLHNARTGRYRRLELTRRAGGAQMPGYNLLDLRGRQLDAGLSEELYSVIGRHLRAGNQALVFLNRRGFAPCLVCANCGWQAECPACERPLTLHRHPPALICHHCGRREPDATACPECGHNSLIPVGQGTQRAEAGLARHFPDVAVYRIDRDTTRSRSRLEAQLDAIREGAPAILVGTQMLAKGHHFPNVTLVAVVNADGGFLSPDFRAPERTAQLIVQVAGRAGREERPGEVYIQTYQPGNPQLRALIDSGYAGFADKELVTREAAALPPYCPIALLRAEAANAAAAESWLAHARGLFEDGLEVYGPAPAIIPRVADRWRYQLLITAPRRAVLHRGIRRFRATMEPARDVRWSLDIDPYDTF